MNYPMPAQDMSAAPGGGDAPQMMPAASHRFTRPGKRPLVFQGTQLAMAMSFTPDIPYWYEINIFRSEEQNFVLVVKLFFQSEIEQDYTKAWEADSLIEVLDMLEHYDAAEDIRVAVPEMDTIAPAELATMAYAMEARVRSQRAHWASLIGELFGELEAAGQGMN